MTKYTKHGQHDIIIIGSGGAGLASALYAKDLGFDVAVISKVHPLKSHTIAAQGGINAALGTHTADDWRWHMHDTLKAGHGLADEAQVRYMCRQAPSAIKYLQSLGVQFDLDAKGNIDQKTYGGQRQKYGAGPLARRACYAKDKTGQQVMGALYEAAMKKGVKFYNYFFLIDLLTSENNCYGALCLDLEAGENYLIRAEHTIIASGGYSQIYQTSTSARTCTGDGIAVAARAGAMLRDMEFVQFHPTAIDKIGVLITEAARSAGGKLLNSQWERFMLRYEPEMQELATRDVVARAVATEMNRTGQNVYLDITHLSRQQIKQELPTIYENCQQFLKLDPSCELIPIAPAAHYTMGGLAADINCRLIYKDGDKEGTFHGTPFYGLYAVGEAACLSVHGAGRLGCNSLLDLITFGQKVIKDIANHGDNKGSNLAKYSLNYSLPLSAFSCKNNTLSPQELKAQLKVAMDKYGGVFRNEQSLCDGIEAIKHIQQQSDKLQLDSADLRWNSEIVEFLELQNMLLLARATLQCALARQESRGAHYRADYPQEDPRQASHSEFIIGEKNLC